VSPSRLHPTVLIYIAAAVIAAVNLSAVGYRLGRPQPTNPWESALIVDAWRLANGQTVYERPEATGAHATTMYGPLQTLCMAGVFRMAGPNNYVGRGMTAAAALAVVLFVPWLMAAGHSLGSRLVGAAMLLGLHLPMRGYFAEARPDVAAVLFSVVAVACWARGWEAERRGWYALGLAALIAAVLFKQTAAAMVIVPGLVAIISPREVRRRRLAAALLPPLAVAATFLTIRLTHPIAVWYLLDLPSQYPIRWQQAITGPLVMVRFLPLAVVLMADWWLSGGPVAPQPQSGDSKSAIDDAARVRWALAAFFATAIAAVLAQAKFGGDRNSFLPPLVALSAISIARLDRLLDACSDATRPALARWGLATLTAWLLAAGAFAEAGWGELRSHFDHGDNTYPRVIAALRDLPGRVVCPDDPTLVLYSRGQPGRTLMVEMDAALHPASPPDYVLADVRNADWLVQVNGRWQRWLTDERLRALGFVPAEESFGAGAYRLWRKGGK
jgi:hypothetical protein